MVLRLHSTATDDERRFEQANIVVGREPGSDLALDDGSVSKVHALIARVDGVYRVRDAGSTNGTRVGGREAVDWVTLRPGDEVRFGPTQTWTVVACSASRPEAPLDPTRRRAGEPPLLTVWSATGDDGGVRVATPSGPVDLRPPANRFKLLYVLATAAASASDLEESWIDDDLLRARIWTRGGARDRSAQALNVLLSYTRRLLEDAGLPGAVLEKERGRTRLRLAEGQVRVVDAGELPPGA